MQASVEAVPVFLWGVNLSLPSSQASWTPGADLEPSGRKITVYQTQLVSEFGRKENSEFRDLFILRCRHSVWKEDTLFVVMPRIEREWHPLAVLCRDCDIVYRSVRSRWCIVSLALRCLVLPWNCLGTPLNLLQVLFYGITIYVSKLLISVSFYYFYILDYVMIMACWQILV